jgi:hypothetical protein
LLGGRAFDYLSFMVSEHASVSFDDRASRVWMALSASGGVIVAACLAAIRRHRARRLSLGSMSADWLRRHEGVARKQGEGG